MVTRTAEGVAGKNPGRTKDLQFETRDLTLELNGSPKSKLSIVMVGDRPYILPYPKPKTTLVFNKYKYTRMQKSVPMDTHMFVLLMQSPEEILGLTTRISRLLRVSRPRLQVLARGEGPKGCCSPLTGHHE